MKHHFAQSHGLSWFSCNHYNLIIRQAWEELKMCTFFSLLKSVFDLIWLRRRHTLHCYLIRLFDSPLKIADKELLYTLCETMMMVNEWYHFFDGPVAIHKKSHPKKGKEKSEKEANIYIQNWWALVGKKVSFGPKPLFFDCA